MIKPSKSIAITAAIAGIAHEEIHWGAPIITPPPSPWPDSGANYRSRSKYKPRIDTPKCERNKPSEGDAEVCDG